MRDEIEKEFLFMLYSNSDITFDLLQIKPDYLDDEDNKQIFKVFIESYKKLGIVDYSYVIDTLNPGLLDKFADIVASNYVIIDLRKNFMLSQKSILDYFKKKVISQLTKKLSNKELSFTEYFTKLSKIEKINIEVNNQELTLKEIENNINTEKNRIILSNFPKLDKLLELVEGDFLVVGASTGTGKSGLLLNFMNCLMSKYQCIYFNMEMSKSTIYKRMIAINAQVPVKAVPTPYSDYQKQIIETSKQRIISNKVIVEHESTYLEDIENFIKTRKNEENKHTILFLDHIGLIRLKYNSKSIYEQTTDVVKSLRQLCLKYDCTIIAACQLNRTSYNSEEFNLSMLKDSGEIENSASKIILLYREKGYSSDCLEPNMILDICKNRDGMEGQITCSYDKSKQIFKEIVKNINTENKGDN